MFHRARVIAALEAKRRSFAELQERVRVELDRYEQALASLAGLSQVEVERRLEGIEKPGARPTQERIAGLPVVRAFERRWANHQEARAWAMEVLRGVPTLAVDGSQITPSGDYSLPVGAVQVGWFENPHRGDEDYVKDIRFEVLAPHELAEEEDDAGGGFPDREVNLRRFELECRMLREYVLRMAGREPVPVCFFDGSLVISFAAQMRPTLQRRYVRAIQDLLEASEEARVPLVGYVDNSRATDLVSMLSWLMGDTTPPSLSDGTLLRNQMIWGDRSEALVCARDDRLDPELAYYHRVHFLYLKTTDRNPPARLDLPSWLLDAGQLGRVVDVVRAECVIGTGYPYALETADAVAVITARDRERFYRTFQEFVASIGLELRYARKAYSKRGRR